MSWFNHILLAKDITYHKAMDYQGYLSFYKHDIINPASPITTMSLER